jgi:hypothetical protein
MKKIMFMMMPLFLTALIFGAGCDQDPSTDKDTGNSGGGDGVVADVTMQAKDNDAELLIDKDGILHSENASVTQADWTKTALKTVRFITAKSTGAKGTLKVKELKDDETYPVFVPAGKTLILSGDGEITAKTTVVVEGNLYVENGSLLVGTETSNPGNHYSEGRILLRNAGVLRLYDGTILEYGDKAKVTSILKGEVSALKNGGIDFKKGSLLDLTPVLSGEGSDFILVKTAPNLEDTKYITLDDVYANSAPASVFINQGDLTSDYIIDFLPASPAYDRVLIVNGKGNEFIDSDGKTEQIFADHTTTITIPAGLVYMNIRSDLEHKEVVVNGALVPARKVYPRTLTVAPGAGYAAANESDIIPVKIKDIFHLYDNTVGPELIPNIIQYIWKDEENNNNENSESGFETAIDNGLNVSGIGNFQVLTFTDNAGVTVNAGGTVTIGKDHTFNYSPIINGLLELEESATLNSTRSIEAGNGGNLVAGDFKLNSGILSANTNGTIYISVANKIGNVVLNGNSTFRVIDRLDVGNGTVSVGSLAWSNNTNLVREDALTLNKITLKGEFTLTGGTESATINAAAPVTIVRVDADKKETVTGELTGNIVFHHGTTGAESEKRFIFDANTLSTNGYESSLVLGSSGEIMYDGVSLSHGTYYVTTENDYYNQDAARFAIGQLNIASGKQGLGIGIGREGVAGNYSGYNTRLVLDSNSTITFNAPLDKQAYLLTGQGLGDRLVSFDYYEKDSWPNSGGGTETSQFAIVGTRGSIIKIDNVIIAGSLGHVAPNKVNNPVPLFAYDSLNLAGTLANGSLTVIGPNNPISISKGGGGGGSLTVDHNYTWTWIDSEDAGTGWRGTKPANY